MFFGLRRYFFLTICVHVPTVHVDMVGFIETKVECWNGTLFQSRPDNTVARTVSAARQNDGTVFCYDVMCAIAIN